MQRISQDQRKVWTAEIFLFYPMFRIFFAAPDVFTSIFFGIFFYIFFCPAEKGDQTGPVFSLPVARHENSWYRKKIWNSKLLSVKKKEKT